MEYEVQQNSRNNKYILEQNNQRCNILYITTLCNLNCDYCYEKKDRDQPGFKHKTVTKDEIDSFIKEIRNREGGEEINKQVSIFGGEAFLRYDLIEYALIEMTKHLKNTGIDLITNGTTLADKNNLKKLVELIKYCKENGVFVSIEFSYDGRGNERRVWNDGTSSTSTVIQAMDNAFEMGIEFFISYTIHKDNYVKEDVIKDTINIMHRYQGYLTDFSLNFYTEEILNETNWTETEFNEYKDWIRQRCIALFYKYDIPTCELICDVCSKCEKGTFVGNNYFIPEYGNEFRDTMHLGNHDHFTITK